MSKALCCVCSILSSVRACSYMMVCVCVLFRVVLVLDFHAVFVFCLVVCLVSGLFSSLFCGLFSGLFVFC